MFAVGYLLQAAILNRAIGADILPPLLMTFGLSIIIQNGLLEVFSADSRRLDAGDLETASLPLGGGIAIGTMPLLTLATAVLVIVALNQLFYRTALGRAFRAVSDDPSIAQLMGIDNRKLFAIAMGIALAVAALAGALPRHPRQFRSDHRPGAADLRLRGGDHRRARQPVGHARRRHRHRHRPDRGRGDQSGMADPRRPPRLPRRADRPAARPLPARGGLRPSCPTWP